MSTYPNKIDLHAHVLPPSVIADLGRQGIEWTGGAGVPPWTLDMSRETMARHSIDVSVVSLQPQVYWGNVEQATRWAREGNEFLGGIVQNDGRHFGALASLPLPDTTAALRELEYALDVLKLDGVSMLTSQDGRYLGDPMFEELMHELNRRKAVVIVHPNTTPPGQDGIKLSLPYSLVEFTFDTTRLVSNLLYSGTLERYPHVKFVMPHAGGAVPYLAWRIGFGEMLKPRMKERVPKGVMHYLRTSIFYDTALSTAEPALTALRKFAPLSNIVFGSDWPMAPEPLATMQIARLDAFLADDPVAREAIYRGNAQALFPRFADAASTTSVTVDPIGSTVTL